MTLYLCNGGSNFVLSFVGFAGLGQEHEKVVFDFTAEDLLGCFVVELNNKGQSVGSDELCEGLSRGQRFSVGQFVASLIELLEQDDSGVGCDRVLGEDGGIRGDGKLLVIQSSSDILESLGFSAVQILSQKRF